MRQNQIKLQGKIDESKNKVGVFNMPLPEVERMSKQKTRMNVVELNSTFNQTRYNRYILTTSSQRSRIHILFKLTLGIHEDRPHCAPYNKFERLEIIQHLLLYQEEIKLDLNNRKISGKIPKYLEIKKIF